MAVKKTRFLIRLLLILLVLIVLVHSTIAAVKTFRVQETDSVKVSPEAIDPDNDSITYYYSSPLDDEGKWQTDYDDAGEYEIEITASDGINQTIQKILLIVDNKNQPPEFTEEDIVIKEKQIIDLKEFIIDPDDDELSYEFNSPFDENGVWETNYDDAGSYTTSFKVSDDEYEVKFNVKVEVLNTNQPPIIVNSFSSSSVVEAKENETLSFYVSMKDNDEDPLTYQWKLDEAVISEEKEGEYFFDFESAGEHTLAVAIEDGVNEVKKEWIIDVEDVNRVPDVIIPSITVKEGEKAILDLPETDQDGDILEYSFDEKFNDQGEWQTDYDDAGEYEILTYISDEEFIVEESIIVEVTDVDRAPLLSLPEKLEVKEGEELTWTIDTKDPDDDEISVYIESDLSGASFNSKTNEFSWTPDYDFIRRKGGFISNILNYLRLEKYFLRSRDVDLTITSCGKDLCRSKSVDLTVYNVNRKPIFEDFENVYITETESIKLSPKAVDPDGDIVRYYFTEPFGKKNGKWETNFKDEGIHTVYVTATDGDNPETIPINVTVLKKNREPKFDITKDEFEIDEGEELNFRLTAWDPDKDNVSINLESIPPGASYANGIFTWKPTYDTVNITNKTESVWNRLGFPSKEENVIWLEFVASDGEFDVIHPVKITVDNVNQKPEIIDYLPSQSINARIGEPVIFHLAAKDFDNDELKYKWKLGVGEEDVKGVDTIERTFTSSGDKKVKVEVSDGEETVEKEWLVNVAEEEYTESIPEEIITTPASFYVNVIEH